MTKRNPKKCPNCGSTSYAEIAYGYPIMSRRLDRELDAGRVVLGGCVVSDDDPLWRCNDCSHRWGKLRLPNGSAKIERELKRMQVEPGNPQSFRLRLYKTWYERGYFNIDRDFDHLVREAEGPITLVLGKEGKRLIGRLSRSDNRNGIARIIGGGALRDWFQANHEVGELIDVDLASMDSIRLG